MFWDFVQHLNNCCATLNKAVLCSLQFPSPFLVFSGYSMPVTGFQNSGTCWEKWPAWSLVTEPELLAFWVLPTALQSSEIQRCCDIVFTDRNQALPGLNERPGRRSLLFTQEEDIHSTETELLFQGFWWGIWLWTLLIQCQLIFFCL